MNAAPASSPQALETARGVCRALANFPTSGELREEHRAIDSPNRHVVIPTPARDSVAAILRGLRGELALLGVTGVGLFGSVARGDDTDESDVDVAVKMPTAGFEDYVNVGKLLEVNLNRQVGVVRLPFTFPLSAMAGGDLEMLW